MKTIILLTLTVCLLAGGLASRAANDPTGALQKGLFEEEANHNLDAAIAAYQSLVTQFDQDRKLAATAVFRLGECYRKLGRTNEAVVQYQRVLRDFSDQPTLVTLSRQDLGALGAPGAVSAEANVLAAQLAGLEKLKNDPEERARAVLALFPDDQLKNMLLNLPPLQEQEARWKADPNMKRDWLQIAIGPEGAVPPFGFMPQVGPGCFRSGSMLGTNHLADAQAELNAQLAQIAQRVDFIVGNQKARLQVLQAGAGAGATAPGAVSEEANVLAAQLAGLEKLKSDPEERARAVLALFPDEALKKMLLHLPVLQEQEAKAKANTNAVYEGMRAAVGPGAGPLEDGKFSVRQGDALEMAQLQQRNQLSLIAQRVDFILGLQKSRLQALQAGAGSAASGETANASGAAPAPDAEQREIQRIQTLLAQSPDLINAPGKSGETLLQAAAGKGQLEVVQFLLDHGAAVNDNRPRDIAPLHYAAGNGRKAVVDLLLRRGAKVDAQTENGVTPLHLAALKGYTLVAKALVDAGAPINVHTINDVNWSGEDLQYEIGGGSTPLDLSIALGFPQIAELLLDAKADPSAPGYRGVPPLVSAVANGQKTTVQALLDHGADVNAADSNGNTALHRAAQNGSPELVSLLLAHKADVNAKDKNGSTPLHLAAASGNVAAIQALVAAKADVNARNKYGETPLLLAARNQKREAAEALLAAGADPNLVVTAADNIARNLGPLTYAVAVGDASLTRDLLDHGANPNLTAGNWPMSAAQQTGLYSYSSGTTTALDGACLMGNAPLAKLLLDHGADPNARNGQQQTPLLSQVVDKPEILRLLLEHKADPKLTNQYGDTPLHAAVRSGNTNSVALLVAHGAEINARDNAGNTPLHLAVTARNKDLVEFLLTHQADPNLLNQYGQTPLDLTKLQAAQPPGFSIAPPGQVGAPPPKYASPAELADLLRQHGAQDWVPRPGQITVTRRSTGTAYPVFRQGTNALNRFTLFEVIAALPWGMDNPNAAVVPFPDFSKVTITRRDPKTGKLTDIPVDVAALVAAGDCSKDVPLERGDLVDIPDREHKLNEQWQGLPLGFVDSLAKCLARKITVEVKGQRQEVTLAPSYGSSYLHIPAQPRPQVRIGPPDQVVFSIRLPFRLKDVLTGSARLLSTSDLTRVTVRRVDPATGQPREWVFNEQTMDPANDLWVRDGDVIAVPEKP